MNINQHCTGNNSSNNNNNRDEIQYNTIPTRPSSKIRSFFVKTELLQKLTRKYGANRIACFCMLLQTVLQLACLRLSVNKYHSNIISQASAVSLLARWCVIFIQVDCTSKIGCFHFPRISVIKKQNSCIRTYPTVYTAELVALLLPFVVADSIRFMFMRWY